MSRKRCSGFDRFFERELAESILTREWLCSDNTSALEDLEQLLVLSPNDVLGLSLRAKLRAMQGDLDAAQDDLASTNLAVRNDLAYRSRLGDGELDLEYLVSYLFCSPVPYKSDGNSRPR